MNFFIFNSIQFPSGGGEQRDQVPAGEAARGDQPRAADQGQGRDSEEGRHRVGSNMSSLLEDQVRGWYRPPLQLLQREMLRSMWRQSHAAVEQIHLGLHLVQEEAGAADQEREVDVRRGGAHQQRPDPQED